MKFRVKLKHCTLILVVHTDLFVSLKFLSEYVYVFMMKKSLHGDIVFVGKPLLQLSGNILLNWTQPICTYTWAITIKLVFIYITIYPDNWTIFFCGYYIQLSSEILSAGIDTKHFFRFFNLNFLATRVTCLFKESRIGIISK